MRCVQVNTNAKPRVKPKVETKLAHNQPNPRDLKMMTQRRNQTTITRTNTFIEIQL